MVTTGTSSSTHVVLPESRTVSEHVCEVRVVTRGGFGEALSVKVVSVLELASVAYSVFVGDAMHAIRDDD